MKMQAFTRTVATAWLVAALLAGCATPRPSTWLAPSAPTPSPPVAELELEAAWFIDNREGPTDLSGLTIVAGKLLTVSDKDPEGIWEIIPPRSGQGEARLRKHFEVEIPPLRRNRGDIDFEGITSDPEGHLYLISENYSRILTVAPDGKINGWLATPDLEGPALAEGLLAVRGGRWEGLAWVGPGQFYLAAEREPRGLLYLQIARYRSVVRAVNLDATRYPPGRGRKPDFGDLFYDGRTLWALHRNAEVISPLVSTDGNRIVEGDAWSYRATAARPEFQYEDDRFGLGEGLALTDQRVYVLYDNNNQARRQDAEDRRPVLLVFRRPLSARDSSGKLP